MRPKKLQTTRSDDLFRARLDQIINLRHELAQLAGAIDWDWIDGEIAPLYMWSLRTLSSVRPRRLTGLLAFKLACGRCQL